MKPNKSRPQYSTTFGFQKESMLVSYVPKKEKAVILLSTMHSDSAASIDPETGDKNKPEVITFYNKTKGGVDSADKKTAATCARRTNRWPIMAVFYSLLNKACLNAFIIHVSNKNKDHRQARRDFLRDLGKQLIRSQLHERLSDRRGLQTELQKVVEACAFF